MYKGKYTRYSDDGDHDHCVFCRPRFAVKSLLLNALHEGYTITNVRHLICEFCYRDFNRLFLWTVEEQSS